MPDSMLAPLAIRCIPALMQFLALYGCCAYTAAVADRNPRWQAQRGAFFVPCVCPLLYHTLYGFSHE